MNKSIKKGLKGQSLKYLGNEEAVLLEIYKGIFGIHQAGDKMK